MGLGEVIRTKEKVYHGEKDITYLLCEKEGSNKLIITFPGFTNAGMFIYRYVRTLKDANANRLFFLDNFGFRGCYLLGENRSDSVEKSVISLINQVMEEKGIKKDNVILQGSSKGGWMALYYGIKYGFGNVIAGGPQTKIGDFLIRHESDKSLLKVADYIAGGHDEEERLYLNNILYNLLENPPENFPNIYIHIGKGDSHLPDHIIPFQNELEKINVKCNLHVQEYYSHSGLAWYYPEYLLETLHQIDPEIIDHDIHCCPEQFDLEHAISKGVKTQIDRVIEHHSMVSIKGWSIIEDENNEDYHRYMLLKSEDRTEAYLTTKESRADVVRHFNNPKYRYSGFTCRFNREKLNKPFKIGMLFISKEDPSRRYYKKVNKEFSLTSPGK